MKISSQLAVLFMIAAFAPAGAVRAQQAAKSKVAPPATAAPATPPQAEAAPANPPAPPGWAARCSSASRDAPLERAIEQTAVLSKTGQLLVLVNVRVPSDTHTA